jgi:hypothetical protein
MSWKAKSSLSRTWSRTTRLDADPSRLGERLQTRRDIHPIAEDVVLLSDHVA